MPETAAAEIPAAAPAVPAPLRIAAFGIRTLPPARGAAGSDTVAAELYPRLAARGHQVTAYCRTYAGEDAPAADEFEGVRLIHLRTVSKSGFDTLLHSLKATAHIIRHDTADVVHVHNGGNSIFALPLRMAGKRVYVAQDGLDFKRKKWSWYAKAYLWLSMYLTAYLPSITILDNVFARDYFTSKFGRRFLFVPYGADFAEPTGTGALERFELTPGGYLLFVGRFIPEKGIHYVIDAFAGIESEAQLVIVGGSPTPDSEYERRLRETTDERVRFVGYAYGDEMLQLMRGCACYVQASDIEGLSPVLLTAMGLGTPVVCSDIPENLYAVGDTAVTFSAGNVASLRERLGWALEHPAEMREHGTRERERALAMFSWDRIVEAYERIFTLRSAKEDASFLDRFDAGTDPEAPREALG